MGWEELEFLEHGIKWTQYSMSDEGIRLLDGTLHERASARRTLVCQLQHYPHPSWNWQGELDEGK
jgi:hypothetical protein